MDDELLAKARDFAATNPKVIASCPEWVKRVFEWSKEECKKTV